MTMVTPFLSLYIETMGDFSSGFVQIWSGLIFAITFVTAFIFAPIWGKIGDKHGRKKILIFSATGIGLSVLLMGFATTVWQLFLLRLFMGVATGFIPMSQAFISTQTPKHVAGKVLGTLQTGSVTGTLMGPMIGGVLADSFGYSSTFQWISLTIFISALLVVFGVKEIKVDFSGVEENDYTSYTSRQVLSFIIKRPVLLMVLLLSALVQIAHFSIQPILSLFVAELHGPANLAFFAGLVFSAVGLGNLLMARSWGKIADKVGYIKILILLLFLSGLVYFPAAFVTNIWSLMFLRFLLGLCIGGIVPVRVAYIRWTAPISMQGEVLGYNTSLRFFGNVIGPAIGGVTAAFYGFSAVFIVTSLLLILSGVFMLIVWYKNGDQHRHQDVSYNH